jgi:apolipoprotein N-acyltransferase
MSPAPSFASGTFAPRARRVSLRALGIAVLGGALSGAAHPLVISAFGSEPVDPSGLSGLLALVALAPVLVVTQRLTSRQAFGVAALAMSAHFLVIAHMAVTAFHTFGGVSLPVAVVMMLLVCLFSGLELAIPFWIANKTRARFDWPAWLTFPCALAAVELFRNYAPFGGMPWGTPGNALATIDLLRQTASLVGVYGLGLVVGLCNAVLADVLLSRAKVGVGVSRQPFPKVGFSLVTAVLITMVGWGAYRLAQEPAVGPTVRVGLLQASIPQDVINGQGQHEEIRRIYQELQADAVARGAELVVWPEAALVPSILEDAPKLAPEGVVAENAPAEAVPPAALVGALTRFSDVDPESGRLVRGAHTSALLASGPGLEVQARFHKTHLVPFGEYVPWPFSLVMKQLTTGTHGLVAGEKLSTASLAARGGEVTVGATICFEGVFPEVSRGLAAAGATQLFNLTNDAWYGTSSTPWHHLWMYALRATETGRPVARAANSGVSAVFDARGRMLVRTGVFTREALVADVPSSSERTVYARFGNWLIWPAVLWSVGVLALLLVTRRKKPTLP